MIIKIPIYVEIGTVSDPDHLKLVGDKFAKEFYLTLRKKSYEKFLKQTNLNLSPLVKISDLQILSTDQALESLRTKK